MALSPGMAMSAHQDVLEASTPDTDESKARLLDEIKNRARSAIATRNYKDADLLYRKGLTLTEDAKQQAILYANLALVERSMGFLEESKKSALEATQLDPTYVKGYWRLGQALASLGETQKALEAMEEAKQLEPSNKALVKECEKLKKRLLEEEQANQEKSNHMDVEEPVVKTIPKPTATTKPKTTASSATTTTSKDTEDGFTQSDVVKGYKVVNGKKTSYFHNELSEKDRALIGDIAPKKLSEKPVVQQQTTTEGASAWNKAGTWEERDVTSWAKDTLQAALLTTSYVLPESSPDPGAVAKITQVPTLDGHASYATVRGKKRYIYEFCIKLKWELENDEECCQGSMTFPDVDGTCELGEGYDMVDYTVHADTPSTMRPLLDRFVKSGGLRDALHTTMDDWVRMFRATY